jgi:hypothetical protein
MGSASFGLQRRTESASFVIFTDFSRGRLHVSTSVLYVVNTGLKVAVLGVLLMMVSPAIVGVAPANSVARFYNLFRTTIVQIHSDPLGKFMTNRRLADLHPKRRSGQKADREQKKHLIQAHIISKRSHYMLGEMSNGMNTNSAQFGGKSVEGEREERKKKRKKKEGKTEEKIKKKKKKGRKTVEAQFLFRTHILAHPIDFFMKI